MNIKFKKIHLYNFLSFGDETITLNDGGYTLVCGRNENPDDLAASNGSGKSSIWEGISWCLTGETIRGSKDIVNLNGSDGALVELEFDIDKHQYLLQRTKDHSQYKTTLKVYIDGEDKSGKGIRDTEKLLGEYLPDLTSQLIGSVIILGQGLPQRFTNNTPSGRKEVLEKLSKSDFMISDLKDRISTRKIALTNELRVVEDNILKAQTELNINKHQKNEYQIKLDELNQKVDLQEQINTRNDALITAKEDSNDYRTLISNIDIELQSLKNEIDKSQNDLLIAKTDVNSKYDEQIKNIEVKSAELKSDIRNLQNEINKLDSITDVCPTCGQRLPDVQKPDTTSQRHQLSNLQESSSALTEEINALRKSKTEEINSLTEQFNASVQQTKNSYAEKSNKKTTYQLDLNAIEAGVKKLENEIVKLEFEKENLEVSKQECSAQIIELGKKIEENEKIILYNNNRKEDIITHSEVINKMSTIITRDFRGYLLTNVIDFINNKAKEYSKEVFETDKIDFKLDGNNISISYDSKEYENLSGGEKQKVDLLVQFALRDMLCKFLNFSSNIIVLDELFDNLDSVGCQRVLNLISKKLNDVDSIFIVTHHGDIPIPTDRELVIVKGVDKISRISNAI